MTRLQRKVGVVMACMVLPYVCAIFLFVRYLQVHPGPVPRWISLAMLGVLVVTFVVGTICIKRVVRQQVATETPFEGDQRRKLAAKGLKGGLILYGLILLNGIRLVLEGDVPWRYAIPGLAIDLLMIGVCWFCLRRLQKGTASNLKGEAGMGATMPTEKNADSSLRSE